MSDALVVCAGCYRHVRVSERACPFCRAALDAPPPASRPGARHTAVIAAALALAATDRAHAQQNPPESPRFAMPHGGASAYGAPPPMNVLGNPEPPVVSHAPAIFELSRQPPNARGAQWSSEIVVRADGTWTASGRSGHLTPAEMTNLRTIIAHTHVRLAPRPRVNCAALPTTNQRVSVGRATVSWLSPCDTPPDPSVERLVSLVQRLTRG